MTAALDCGCVPLPGGGIRSRCAEAAYLWVRYLSAIEADPSNRAAWWDRWVAYADHIELRGETWTC